MFSKGKKGKSDKLQADDHMSLLSDRSMLVPKETPVKEIKTLSNYGSFGPPSIGSRNLPPEVDTTIFTTEGRGLIDFILAYQPSEMNASQRKYRETFEKKLRKEGLYLETEDLGQSQDGKTCFVKIHAPWKTLAKMAEINRMKIPIQKSDIEEERSDKGACHKLTTCFCCGKDPCTIEQRFRPPEIPTYFTLEFSKNKLSQYLIQDANTFFTQIQRIRTVWDIIERTTVASSDITRDQGTLLKGHSEGEAVGVDFLIQHKIFVAAYPLHDGDLHVDPENKKRKPTGVWPLRPWLYETWSRPGRWLTAQPLDQIRSYYGEKVALYFAWLGFYTKMLIPFTLLGMVVFIFGLVTYDSDIPVQEACSDAANTTWICRSCASEICSYTSLRVSCTAAKIDRIFSNVSTLAFAFLSSLWAILFLEFWKREQARLTCKWDTFDVEFEGGPPRPEYQAAAQERRRNPISREWEPYIPPRSIWQNFALSISGITFMLIVVVGVITGVILYKAAMVVIFYNLHDPLINSAGASTVSTVTASIINAICIMILEKVYGMLAWRFTEKEYPRTTQDFENSYTYKMFLFQFVNYYATLFYLAFVQGYMAGDPKTNSIFTDSCPPVGCMFSVTSQLLTILTVKQIFNNLMELGLPMIKNWMKRRKNVAATEENVYARWEKDFDLEPLPTLSLFGEYFEMVMQFGFVTMFVAAFPLAPLLALLNNIVEIRLDAFKFTGECRRVIPHRASDMGTWYEILEQVARLAVITNALIIAFTTNLLDKLVYAAVYSEDGSLSGFLNFTLAYFETAEWNNTKLTYNPLIHQDTPICRFRGYYNPPLALQTQAWRDKIDKEVVPDFVKKIIWDESPPYEFSSVWWRMMVVKLGFVLIFEHVVFGFQSLLQYAVPDIPEEVDLHVQRNRHVSKLGAQMMHHAKEHAKSGQGDNISIKSSRSQRTSPGPISPKRTSNSPASQNGDGLRGEFASIGAGSIGSGEHPDGSNPNYLQPLPPMAEESVPVADYSAAPPPSKPKSKKKEPKPGKARNPTGEVRIPMEKSPSTKKRTGLFSKKKDKDKK